MFTWKNWLVLTVFTLLIACGTKEPKSFDLEPVKNYPSSNSDESASELAKMYMDLVKVGDAASAKALYCYPEHFAQSLIASSLIVSRYEIPEGTDLVANPTPGVRSLQDSALTYTRAQVVVNPESADRVVVKISVWNTDEHYQAAQIEDAEWKAVGGDVKYGRDRARWTQAAQCVDDIDMYSYNKRLATGLTKAEIDNALGSPGEQVSDSQYRWKIPTSRSAVEVSFVDGKASIIENLKRY